jgi:hypothetical protein
MTTSDLLLHHADWLTVHFRSSPAFPKDRAIHRRENAVDGHIGNLVVFLHTERPTHYNLLMNGFNHGEIKQSSCSASKEK